MYKGKGVRLADFISVFLNNPLRPNYFTFIKYLEIGQQGGGSSEHLEPPLDAPLYCECEKIKFCCKFDLFTVILIDY